MARFSKMFLRFGASPLTVLWNPRKVVECGVEEHRLSCLDSHFSRIFTRDVTVNLSKPLFSHL